MATIYDVARLAKVSTTTVSKVLSNTPYVSAQTKKRVLEAMHTLQYSPSLIARGLTSNRTYVLGLIVPYYAEYLFRDPFIVEIICGVEAAASEMDYNVLLSMSNRSDQRSAYDRFLRTGYVDGVITVETMQGGIVDKELDAIGIPRITAGYREDGKEINSIHSDDYSGGLAAGRYLLSLGHRNIGVISGPPEFIGAVAARLKGAEDALAEYGLLLKPEMVVYGDFSIESGYAQVETLLQREERPTALFSMNDRMALGAMRRARELGLEIPADLSLVGFDDVPLTAFAEPALTTLRQYPTELGKLAAQHMFSLLNVENKPFSTVVHPVTLIVRGSTQPPR